MCLQWCHVRDILIDNDLDCKLWCPLRGLEKVALRLGESVPPALLQAHGIRSLGELFLVVDNAPDLPPGSPADGIELDGRYLSVPLVYGVRARCWEKALYGDDPFGWCGDDESE